MDDSASKPQSLKLANGKVTDPAQIDEIFSWGLSRSKARHALIDVCKVTGRRADQVLRECDAAPRTWASDVTPDSDYSTWVCATGDGSYNFVVRRNSNKSNFPALEILRLMDVHLSDDLQREPLTVTTAVQSQRVPATAVLTPLTPGGEAQTVPAEVWINQAVRSPLGTPMWRPVVEPPRLPITLIGLRE